MEKLRNVLHKYLNRETMSYLIFGVLTTVLNYAVFWVFLRIFGEEAALAANVVAFIAAVIFAYITNKLYVFESKSWKLSVLKKEISSFLSARLLTFALEELGLLVAANLLHLGRYAVFGVDGILLSKLFLNVLVVIGNYILSKWIIFKK